MSSKLLQTDRNFPFPSLASDSQMGHDEATILKSDPHDEIEIPIISQNNDSLSIPPRLCCDAVCAFSQQKTSKLESEQRSNSATKLWGLIFFYILVMTVEIVGGVKANSLAVITDAAHLLTDIIGFSISLFTIWAAGWKATPHQSFGYSRLEVLGALISVQLIWLISGFLIYEAIDRILHRNSEVHGMLMFVIAAFGFIINLIMVCWLGHDHSHHDHSHHCHNHDHDHDLEKHEEASNLVPISTHNIKMSNINIQGAYLHVMADMIQSVGVMISGAIIWAKPDWLMADLICTLVFSVVALWTTKSMLINVFGILLERTPREIDIARLENSLNCIKGVADVHDLHVWSITAGKVVLSCHVIAEPGISSGELIHKIRYHCEKRYNILHVTIQVE